MPNTSPFSVQDATASEMAAPMSLLKPMHGSEVHFCLPKSVLYLVVNRYPRAFEAVAQPLTPDTGDRKDKECGLLSCQSVSLFWRRLPLQPQAMCPIG